jgi:DNA-directed RNA polymerase specialized sigma24 family protein
LTLARTRFAHCRSSTFVISFSEVQRAEVTLLLHRWSRGDHSALAALTPVVYSELRRLAAARLRNERDGHTLQPTALIHEAWLKLVGQDHRQWQNRAQFFSVASRIMREILVDNARRFRAEKRGAGKKEPIEAAVSFAQSEPGLWSNSMMPLTSCRASMSVRVGSSNLSTSAV